MGVNISDIILKNEIDLSDLKNKVIAVDAYNILYQFLTTIRQYDGTPLMDKSGNITSHISGLLYRNLNLISEGIKLVYVFDGVPPELKEKEIKRRQKVKECALEKFNEALKEQDVESMKKYSSRDVHLTDTIIKESKELLVAMGIPIIDAPSEGEAEAASLAKKGLVWASASQDYDSLLYGAPYLVRNLTLAKKRKTRNGYVDVKLELIEFNSLLRKLDIDRDQLICLAILVGTDYNPGGIKGIGQKTALEIVKRYKYPFEIFKFASEKYDFIFDWQEIFRLFHEYETSQLEQIIFPKINLEKIENILKSRDFSEERISNVIEKINKINEKKSQTKLFDYF